MGINSGFKGLKFVVQKQKPFLNKHWKSQYRHWAKKEFMYLSQAKLIIYQKEAYYLGMKIFNNLSLETKNVAGNQKKFKIAVKKFVYTYSFYTVEEYLSESWIMYCITKFLIILVLVLRFCLHTLYKYSLIDSYELITFLCINLMWLICVLYS